jgi:hypothetical protein
LCKLPSWNVLGVCTHLLHKLPRRSVPIGFGTGNLLELPLGNVLGIRSVVVHVLRCKYIPIKQWLVELCWLLCWDAVVDNRRSRFGSMCPLSRGYLLLQCSLRGLPRWILL